MNELILVHGMGQDASSWKDVYRNFKTLKEPVCPDLIDLVGNDEYIFEKIYQSFEQFCVKNGTVDLCGLSLGGMLSLKYAIEHPKQVNSLILIGTQYKSPKVLLKIQNTIFKVLPESVFAEVGLTKKQFINLSKSMNMIDFSCNLSKIIFPTLVVCGEGDKGNRNAAKRMAQKIQGAKYIEIANAKHEVNVDNPIKLAHIIEDFICSTGRAFDKN